MFDLWKKKKQIDANLFKITYTISSGIPFKWEFEIENEQICEFVNSSSKGEKTKEPICGGSVETHYMFKGRKEGRTIITFKCINILDNYISKIENYKVKIDKNLDITLISKEEKK